MSSEYYLRSASVRETHSEGHSFEGREMNDGGVGHLSALDHAVLRELKKNPRTSVSSLAKVTGVSRLTASRRLSWLLENGVAEPVVAVHPKVSGRTSLAHISIRTAGGTSALFDFLLTMPEIAFASVVSGTAQIVAEVRTTGAHALYDSIARVRNHPAVVSVSSATYVRILTDSSAFRHAPAGNVKLDLRDQQIIEHLRLNARASYAQIADSVGVSPSAARNRMKSLESRNAIQFITRVNVPSSSGEYEVGFALAIAGPDSEVSSRLHSLGSISFMALSIGKCDLVLTLKCNSRQEIHSVTEAIREVPGVGAIDTWLHLGPTRVRL